MASEKILCHSVEVEGYWKTSPGGRRVFIKSYKRGGNARQDDLFYKSNVVNAAKKNLDYRKKVYGYYTTPGTHSYYHGKFNPEAKRSELQQYIKAKQDYKDALNIAEKYHPATALDKVRYAAIDVAEETKVAVGNFIEKSKVTVGDIVDKTKDVVNSGFRWLRSLFGGR